MSQKKNYEEIEFEVVFFTEYVVIASNGDGVNTFDFRALFGLDDEDEIVY